MAWLLHHSQRSSNKKAQLKLRVFSQVADCAAFSRFSRSFRTDPGQPDFMSHRFLIDFSQNPLAAFSEISRRETV